MLSIKPVKNPEVFENFKLKEKAFYPGNFLQSYYWGDFIRLNKGQVEHFLIYKNNQIIGKFNLEIRKIKHLFKYANLTFGPLLDFEKIKNFNEFQEIFTQIKKIANKKACIFLRFNLPFEKNKSARLNDYLKKLNKIKSQAKSLNPTKTLIIDLTKDEQSILMAMKSKTRYNIRLASKKGVEIKVSQEKADIKKLLKLLEDTSKRDQFKLHNLDYYQKMIEFLSQQGILKLYFAYYKDQVLAANMMIFYNKITTYLHGASSNEKRNLMPTYLLQWQAILDSVQKGYNYYDFWGIDEKKWPGVTKFKLGFSKEEKNYYPAYEMPINNLYFKFYQLIRNFYK
jgi:lipid II:glycine glycyltransferase (peptidoglycan interpeptide bridge formation enzyme)